MTEPKHKWIENVETTCTFHKEALRQANEKGTKWTLESTAKALNRSIGRVSEDLQLGEMLKTHRKQLEKFKNVTDAIEYMRNKKKEMRLM